MPKPRVCNQPGCPEIGPNPRCPKHTSEADLARGTPAQRGYDTPGHRRFRRIVLTRDPLCVLCGTPSKVADHYPLSRRDLVAQGLNPNDPDRGRGLCATCHNRETAQHQPGGWAAQKPHKP